MISPTTGELRFSDGWRLRPQDPMGAIFDRVLATRDLPIPEWRLHDVGVHSSEFGDFEVGAVCGPDQRVCLVTLTHRHTFYEASTVADGERRVYHESILATDLKGQREYPWGEAFCRFDAQDHKDRLVIAYTGGSHIPHQVAEVLLNLEEHERFEQSRGSERRG